MLNKKLKKSFKAILSIALLSATLTTSLSPPIFSNAYEVGGMRNRIPPNEEWSEEEGNDINT